MKKIDFEEVIKKEEADFIQYLLESKININKTNKNGESLIHLCCKYGDLEKYLVLQYMGANLNLTTNEGNSILHYCCKYGLNHFLTLEIARTTKLHLQKNNDGNTPLHFCNTKNDVVYFGNWANINQVDLNKLLNNNNENVYQYNKNLGRIIAEAWVDFLEDGEFFYKKYKYHMVHDNYINKTHLNVFKDDENQKILKSVKKTLSIDQND